MRRAPQRGQAAVDTVGAAFALVVIAALAWQVVVAAHTWQAAQSAARTAARARSVGAPVVRAARTVLPAGLAKRAQVTELTRPSGVVVRVRLPIRSVLHVPGVLGWVDGEAVVVR